MNISEAWGQDKLESMWHLSTPWYEPVIRGIAIYLFIFFLVRIVGKKQILKLSPMDLVVLVFMSGAIQNAIFKSEYGPFSTLISISVFIALNILVHELTYRFNWFEELIEGKPKVIVLNGKIHKRVMKRERVTEAELFEALREHEIMNSDDVKCAILEKDGKISVIKYHH